MTTPTKKQNPELPIF